MPSKLRSGLTVVEVLIALMLTSIGMLGIAGSTTLALRTTLDASRRRAAFHQATARISAIQSAGCAAARSGVHYDPAIRQTERWTVSGPANGFASITDSLAWQGAQGSKSLVLSTSFEC